ncbi:MAG TPA: hypothetical protein VFR82_13035 [Nitrospira sp.]|nr:hypothetical protein [Nitrospira sp.]
MSKQLEQSPILQGVYLESTESARASRGDLYAVVDYPFAMVSDAFTNPENWCEALILHLNIKYCHAEREDGRKVLSVAAGKKSEQPLSETHRLTFAYNVLSGTDYMAVNLDANKGPLGTRNYHVALELIALEGEKSFLHMEYSYTDGFLARLAMRLYFATSGSAKVGFTKVGGENGEPTQLVRGVRGALERNTMRYYLALEAFLSAAATPDSRRFEESLERWYTATERYALQLHEVDRDDYITMKRNEYLRQQAPRELQKMTGVASPGEQL